jgi:hypothetical protein
MSRTSTLPKRLQPMLATFTDASPKEAKYHQAPYPRHPSRLPSLASSSAVNSHRGGAFSRLQGRGFPVVCPRA